MGRLMARTAAVGELELRVAALNLSQKTLTPGWILSLSQSG